jgi:hypothetical protein
MDKREMGGLGLSKRSVEQFERVIDTADTVLYPAHLMIGGWRMFFAAVLLAVYGLCYGLWWVGDSIYHFGVMHTAADICHYGTGLVKDFPYASAIVVLVIGVPLCLLLFPIFRWMTELLMAIWWSRSLGRPPRPDRITVAEIITRGYDPDDFDLEQIDGVVYGRRKVT